MNYKRLFKKACLGALIILCIPASKKGLIIGGLILLAIVIFSIIVERRFEVQHSFACKDCFSIEIVATILLALVFIEKWRYWSLFQIASQLTGISAYVIDLLLTVFVTAFALVGIDYARNIIACILRGKKYTDKLINISSVILIAFLICFMFEYGSLKDSYGFGTQNIVVVIANIFVVIILENLFVLIFKNWKWGLLSCTSFSGIWAIANYFVVIYHGSPLYFSELRNLKTAVTVVGSYSFSLSTVLFTLFAAELFCILLICHSFARTKTIGLAKIFVTTSVMIVFVGVYFLRWVNKTDWNWQASVAKNGFMVCTMKDIKQMLYPYIEPSGYKNWESASIEIKESDNSIETKPDIILILNESFCDLTSITQIETDVDYTHGFNEIPNSVSGFAVTPSIGDGTNNSEFELLTSKSMALVSSTAPFNFVDFEKAESSIVSYVNEFGYDSIAMHCGEKSNYSRNTAYPALGFNEIYLGEEFFTQGYNGNRKWLDSDNFEDLIALYEGNDAPQFLYLLTFQNHGGYNQNNDEEDTVHVIGDYGELTSELNEYMSSVSLSYEAFCKLVEHFKMQDHPVIICMVGDHAPSFIQELSLNENLTTEMKEIAERSVPYIMWSNFNADFSDCSEYVSMVDIAPMLIKAAGLPLSYFYQNILELHEELPIRTSNGIIADSDGIVEAAAEESPYYSRLQEYYYLEYSSLIIDNNYRQELYYAG